MQPLEKEILKLVQQENLIRNGEKILVGVSGGPDSMALLHVLARLASDFAITLAAAYVNHGLRPDEAETEKNLVETEAHKLGVDFFAGSVNVTELAKEQKISTEHAARLLRYNFLEQTAEKIHAAKIAVAHTADDQAEEILLRLIRGTGRKGLSGMKTLRDGRVIRPFLRTPKSRLLEYLENNSIRFLHDSSNDENHFLRNRIRNELLPYLAGRYNPDIRQTLIRTAEILQDEEAFLEKITDNIFAEIVTTTSATREQVKTGHAPLHTGYRELAVGIDDFNRHPRAVQRRLLEKCCWTIGCRPSARQINQLLQLALGDIPGSGLHLSKGLRVAIKGGQLCFTYPRGRGSFRGNLSDDNRLEFPETIIPGPGVYEFTQLGKKLVVEYIDEKLPDCGKAFPTGEFLDSALFSFPLLLRGFKPMDRFHPLGAPGSKKVSDFLSDRKVSRDTRKLTPVLCTDTTILALPGQRIDQHYRITDKTTRTVRVSWDDIGRE